MPYTTIRVKEKSLADDIFTLNISIYEQDGNEEEQEITFSNPYNAQTDRLLEWYFEKYINAPYDNVKVEAAVKAIEEYGKQLFQSIFTGNLLFRYQTALQNSGPDNITIEIIGDSARFQSIYWESLRDLKQNQPLAALGTVFLRKNTKPVNIKAVVQESPTINLLIVTARPNEESDINYRTIQRPLIDLIEQTAARVKPHILRPGTYEAFVRHLDEKAGYYHIIHFDLHGSLLNYEDYQFFQQSVDSLPFRNAMFKGNFALKELKQEDFNNGKKAFVFFESDEKGTAVPVDAGQLADYLEYRQVSVCILNACQSAKQEHSAHETSLGRVLMQKGIQLVLAMRYSVSVSAAIIMMEKLYEQLYKQVPIEQAIADSRQELYRVKERKALYRYTIELEDWLLPVIYQNAKATWKLSKFSPKEEEEFYLKQQVPEGVQQELPYGFFGRDLDILKIEKNLLVRSNILLLQGMGGAGKTTLLKYLAAWWLRTGFIENVFYFGYDIKAYTLNQILNDVAHKVYDRYEYSAFTAMSLEVQEKKLAAKLKEKRYVLIIDNAESITGEKLAIQNTLSENEKKVLKNFVKQLKGAQSLVIVGSRASEEWLKSGTFEKNCYILNGLDKESATDFAHEILESHDISVKTVAGSDHFARLMKLLDGYPLALKAVLPSLKQKTASRILEELQAGIGTLDDGNIQERTESIIKCIEYAHSNLSEEAQQLLLCLAPFQSVVNVAPATISDYFEELKKKESFQNYPFEKFETVIKEAIQNGYMQPVVADGPIGLMALQPVFTFFLKNKLNTEKADLLQSLEKAYINYYRDVSKDFYSYLKSQSPEKQQTGLFYISHEYENLYRVLIMSLNQRESFLDVFNAIDKYLDKKQEQERLLQIGEMVNQKMEEYDFQNTTAEINCELGEAKFKLANYYYSNKRYTVARETYKRVIDWIDTSSSFFENAEPFKGQVYQNLGNVASEQKDYAAAIDYYQNALKIYIQFDNFNGQGDVYHNLGYVAKEQEDYSSAEDYYKKALDVFVHLGDKYWEGITYMGLGNVARRQMNYSDAKNYYLNALKSYTNFDNKFGQGQIYHGLGNVAADQKNYTIAQDYYIKALNVFVQFDNKFEQGRIYQELGIVADEQKDYAAAKEYYHKALNIFIQFPEDLYSINNIILIIYDFAKEAKEKAYGQAMLEMAMDYFEGDDRAYLQKLWNDLNEL